MIRMTGLSKVLAKRRPPPIEQGPKQNAAFASSRENAG
jgi:hypothetical protein